MMQQGNNAEPTGQTATSDRSDRSSVEWLQQRIEHYWDKANDMCEAIEDLGDLDKLGQGFTSADPLEKSRYWIWYYSYADFYKCKLIE